MPFLHHEENDANRIEEFKDMLGLVLPSHTTGKRIVGVAEGTASDDVWPRLRDAARLVAVHEAPPDDGTAARARVRCLTCFRCSDSDMPRHVGRLLARAQESEPSSILVRRSGSKSTTSDNNVLDLPPTQYAPGPRSPCIIRLSFVV